MSIDAGGNSGSQASISIIRIISLNEIRLEKVFRIVFLEFNVAAVCFTLIVTIFSAKIAGYLLSVLVNQFDFNSAVMATLFITTIVEALLLLIYFIIVTKLLNL